MSLQLVCEQGFISLSFFLNREFGNANREISLLEQGKKNPGWENTLSLGFSIVVEVVEKYIKFGFLYRSRIGGFTVEKYIEFFF